MDRILVVDPQGQQAVVDVTFASGTRPTAYSDVALATPVSLPSTITAATRYYFGPSGVATLSCIVGAEETADGATGTRTLDLQGGGVLSIVLRKVYDFAGEGDTITIKDRFKGSAAATEMLGFLVDGDTDDRLSITAGGKLQWGPGNAVEDTNFYRSAAGVLKTDGALLIGSGATQAYASDLLTIDFNADARIHFTSSATGRTSSDGIYVGVDASNSGFNILNYETSPIRFFTAGTERLRLDGKADFGASTVLWWGSAFGTNDTNLYRSAADTLKTDDTLVVVGNLYVNNGASGELKLGPESSGGFDLRNNNGVFTIEQTGVTALLKFNPADAAGLGLQMQKKFWPATDAAAYQTVCALYAGTGAPNNANGANNDFYLRGDGGALTSIYQKRAGAWVGIV